MRRLLFHVSTDAATDAINRWLTLLYGVVVLALSVRVGLSFPVVSIALALLLVHVGAKRLSRRDMPVRYLTTVREGITNALKHGRATVVQVRIEETVERSVALSIADNGEGAKSSEPGSGLSHLEQKVTALGGVVSIDTHVQGGFRLHVLMPLVLEGAQTPLGQTATQVKGDD